VLVPACWADLRLANVNLTPYETLLLDDERFGALLRILRGAAFDEDHLAFAVIQEIVRGKGVVNVVGNSGDSW
jgi:hypothetical protein